MRIQRNKKRKQCKQLVIKNCNFQCSNWSHIIVHVKLIFSEILSKEKSLGWECREILKKKKKKEKQYNQLVIKIYAFQFSNCSCFIVYASVRVSSSTTESLSPFVSLYIYMTDIAKTIFLFVWFFVLSLDYSFPGPFTSDIRLFLELFFCTCLLMGLGCKFLQDPVQNT